MANSYLFQIKDGINLIAGFNNLLLIYVLVRKLKSSSPANPFLVLFLAGIGMANLMVYLYDTHVLEKIPWLFRQPSPLYYLMFPSAWLYVRQLVNDEARLKKWDYLHFLPALVHLVEMMPYYLSDLQNKKQHLLDAYLNPLGNFTHNEGLLPNYAHNALRGLMGIVYCYCIFKDLRKTFQKDNPRAFQFEELKNWLYLFASAVLVLSITIFVSFGFPLVLPGGIGTGLVELSFSITQIITFLTVLSRPHILFGIPKPPPALAQVAPLAKEKPTALDRPNDFEKYVALLENYAATQTSFLRVGFSLGELSKELNIPQHHLSYVLNRILNIRFNDYINNLRVLHLKEHVSSEKLKSTTLEGLALEGGFGNRTTFIRAVKKATGQNPSIFFSLPEKEQV